MFDAIKYNIQRSSFYGMLEARQNNFDLEDVFLVSFPKSGNTWMRFMITGLYLWEINKGNSEPNYFNIHTYVKDLHLERIKQRSYFSGMPRIIKSHRTFSPNYTRVIFVVRDVRDVMISWFNFINRNEVKFKSFDNFLRNPYYGVSAWKYHTDSWLNSATKANKKLLLLRYEDIMDNPINEIKKMLSFLNVKFEEEGIKWSLQQSSKERIKKLESAYGRARTSKVPFLRKGEKDQWKKEMSRDNIDYIIKVAGDTLKACEYEL
jgi:hypothetical protein